MGELPFVRFDVISYSAYPEGGVTLRNAPKEAHNCYEYNCNRGFCNICINQTIIFKRTFFGPHVYEQGL